MLRYENIIDGSIMFCFVSTVIATNVMGCIGLTDVLKSCSVCRESVSDPMCELWRCGDQSQEPSLSIAAGQRVGAQTSTVFSEIQ